MSDVTNILIGITGSADAIYAPAYIRAIREAMPCKVTAILSPEALKFVNPEGISLICERVVLGEDPKAWGTERPSMIAQDQDIMLVLPATANTLAAAAQGTAQNRLTMMFILGDFPVLFFPVMGPSMWDRPVVRRNVATVRELGMTVVDPAWREQYEPNYGRVMGHYYLPDPPEVVARLREALGQSALAAQ